MCYGGFFVLRFFLDLLGQLDGLVFVGLLVGQVVGRVGCIGLLLLRTQFVQLLPHDLHLAQQFVEHLAFARRGVFREADAGQSELILLLVLRQVLAQRVAIDLMLGLQYGYLLGDILELADIAVPVVVLQQLGGLGRQVDRRTAIAVAEIERKLAEEQGYILFAVTQGRYAYLYGIESVVEVLAELTVLGGATHIQVGGGYDAYVGLQYLGATHADILARLQHTQ